MGIQRLFGRQSGSGRRPRNRGDAWVLRLERLEGREVPAIAYTVAASGDALLAFNTASPATTSSLSVPGLLSGEVLDGVDFRTETGQFLAVALNKTTHVARLGTVNLVSGAFVGIGASFSVSSGSYLALSDNPVTDRLQLISDTGVNLSINPNNDAVTANTNISSGTDIAAIAFSNDFVGASSTTLYGINATTSQLVSINTTTWAVTAVGGGLGVNISAAAGFTIMTDGTARAILTVSGTSSLYSINLSTGAATSLGAIGASATITSGLAIAPISLQVTGSGSGTAATVKVYNADGTLRNTITPFGSFTGGVTVATGDVNADGVLDIIVGAGPGGGPEVKVYNGVNLAVLGDFYAYNPTFTGGVFVAAGDMNGDGKADVVTGAGTGGGPQVNVITATGLNNVQGNGQISSSSLIASFFAYNPTFTGGVNVAAADVDLVGGAGVAFLDELITGAGSGGGPNVRVIPAANMGNVQGNGQISDSALTANFFAYSPTFTGGVFVAAGDVNGDGKADIVTGAGVTGGPHVRAIDGTKLSQVGGDSQISNSALIDSFMAFSTSFTGGVRVGVADVNGDGRVDLVAGPGSGMQSSVAVFDATTLVSLRTYTAFDPSFLGGVFVGGAL